MTYFLGSDVNAAITTEHKLLGVSVVAGSGKAYVDNTLIGVLDATDNSADTISTASAHNLTTGDPFMFTMDDDSPSLALTLDGSAAAVGTTYFAILVDADDIKVASSYANAIAGTHMELGGSINSGTGVNTNITRELGSSTVIKNREWPKYDGTGRIDTIVGDSETATGIKTSGDDKNILSDLTGIDLTLGKTDEDVAYFGQKTALKAEIKNEVTVAFTRKKSDSKFETLFQQARDGVLSYTDSGKTAFDIDSATPLASSTLPSNNTVEINNTSVGLPQPDQNFGYRIQLMMKANAEVLTVRNACITDYAISLNPDGITEETITFYGHVKPKLLSGVVGTVTVTGVAEL